MDLPTVRRYLFTALLASLSVIFTVATMAGCRGEPGAKPTVTVDIVSDQPSTSWSPSEPAIPGDTTVTWAYLDSTEGGITRGGDEALHPLDSLVVPGQAADLLNTIEEREQTANANDVAALYAALTGSADAAAELADKAGGADISLARVIDACTLQHTQVSPARATALDVARYGACLREGAIAPPKRSAWVLDQMRNTAGGIGDVRGNDGGQRLAQFNTTADAADGRKRTGCMGVGAYWSAAVFVDWPAARGDLFGVGVCAEVARSKFPPDTQKAPDSPTPPEPSTTCPYDTCRGTD